MPAFSALVRNILAILATVLGLILGAVGIQRANRIDSVNANPTVEWITKPEELESLFSAAVGRYVTGNEPGDRGIEVKPGGHVRLFRILEKGERSDPDVTSRIGRINGRMNLVTPRQGAMEIINIDTLSYYRDVYRRTR